MKLKIFYLIVDKNFYLLHKIVNHPDLFEKLKFLIAFLMPKQVVNYFKK